MIFDQGHVLQGINSFKNLSPTLVNQKKTKKFIRKYAKDPEQARGAYEIEMVHNLTSALAPREVLRPVQET